MHIKWSSSTIRWKWCTMLIVFLRCQFCLPCDTEFDGFGVYLGAVVDLDQTDDQTIQSVVDKLYFDLKLRHFRTSYEPYFSKSPGDYNITCTRNVSTDCHWSWAALLKTLSNKTRYPDDVRIFASIWTPPSYMKDADLVRLLPEFETSYYHFIKNITALIQTEYGIQIERISPVNEPDNIFAPWDHCNMNAHQLCSMVAKFNDSLISLCPENSYFWVTQLFANYRFNPQSVDCKTACQIIATHAYALNINSTSSNLFKAYYDLIPYNQSNLRGKTIWQTEVCSTFSNAQDHQMEEALDLATSIVNFVGTTCVARYYYWYAYNAGPSGESLIWGNVLPKKYYVYNHFTNASFEASRENQIFIQQCTSDDYIDTDDGLCLKFDEFRSVFVNRGNSIQILSDSVSCNCGLCCTTNEYDLSCDFNRYILPPRSVCTCKGGNCV